jgi:hypothetical protein
MCGFKGTVSQYFLFQIFPWIILPQTPENNTRVISNFFWKFAEIFTGQGAPLVSMTPAANLPPVLTSPATNMPPVSTTLVANFATSSVGVGDTGGKFATVANDTGSEFGTGVNDAGGFYFRFFPWITFPQAPENNTRVISNFFQKFAEIFPSQGAIPVSVTPGANLPPVLTTPAAN